MRVRRQIQPKHTHNLQQNQSNNSERRKKKCKCYFLIAISSITLSILLLFMFHRHNDIPQAINPPKFTCLAPIPVPSPQTSRHPFTKPAFSEPHPNPMKKDVDIILAVVSECSNIHLRRTIRETWGRRATKLHLKLIFFVGTRNDCMDSVQDENKIYQDVVVLKNQETYDNLSLKTRSMFQYLYQQASTNPKTLIAKIDDDVYVDVEALVGRLTVLNAFKFLYLGYQHKATCVIRKSTCKWYDPLYPFHSTKSTKSTKSTESTKSTKSTQSQTLSTHQFGLNKNIHPSSYSTDCIDTYPSYAGGMFYVVSYSILSLLASYNSKTKTFSNQLLNQKQAAVESISLPLLPSSPSSISRSTVLSDEHNTHNGIDHLPIWSNEDSTVGTWIHAAMRLNVDVYRASLVHEPAIYPSRMVTESIPSPPMVVHLEWATGQHVLSRNHGKNREKMKSRLMYAAESNLKLEGVAMGSCSNNGNKEFVETLSLRGNGEVQKDERLKLKNGVENKGSFDIYNRYLLYERPRDMFQLESARYLEKICSGKK